MASRSLPTWGNKTWTAPSDLCMLYVFLPLQCGVLVLSWTCLRIEVVVFSDRTSGTKFETGKMGFQEQVARWLASHFQSVISPLSVRWSSTMISYGRKGNTIHLSGTYHSTPFLSCTLSLSLTHANTSAHQWHDWLSGERGTDTRHCPMLVYPVRRWTSKQTMRMEGRRRKEGTEREKGRATKVIEMQHKTE